MTDIISREIHLISRPAGMPIPANFALAQVKLEPLQDGQVLIRNVSDRAIDTFKDRAKLKGTSLEQEVRELIEAHAPFTPEGVLLR